MRGGVALFALLLAGCSNTPRIRVGSKNFSEQYILGEIIAQHLEHRLGGRVSRKFGLGGTLLAEQALESGGIDLYPEYTGTALTAVLKARVLREPAAALQAVREGYRSKGLLWLDPLGFENTFAMTVRREHGANTLTEAAAAGPWRLGAGYEFVTREDGLPGLKKAYALRLDGAPKTMDLGLLYQALNRRQVDMAAGNSTDGLLAILPLKVLTDDRHYFPPYECAIVIRPDVASRFPGASTALAELSGKITSAQMQRMNYALDGKHRPAKEIARDFLKSAGLQ